MNETIETTLLLNLFYFENGIYTKNENFIEAKRRKAIALLDEDADELKVIDPDLAQEYAETISYLETLSDEEYQTKKEELLQQVEVN
ncbi:TPA: transcriptional regulator [Streptococcus suis]|nr:transcriptional regulator [Streptococcus suis]